MAPKITRRRVLELGAGAAGAGLVSSVGSLPWVGTAFAASQSPPIPPTLPQLHVTDPYRRPTGPTISVNQGDDLQTAIDRAPAGATIVLQAGATFIGNFKLPSKTSAAGPWTYIQSSAYGSLPAPGTRANPADASNMPKILTPNAAEAISAEGTASYYRLVGLEIGSAVSTFNPGLPGRLVDLSNEAALAPAQCSQHIVVDRCYVHGSSSINVRSGVILGGAYLAVIDSYISSINAQGYDGQAVGGHNGPGPYLIRNCHLEATGENVMFGGAPTRAASMIPSDITIERNYFFKPLTWNPYDPTFVPLPNGIPWDVKNLVELKCAQRVLIDSNVMQHCWAGGQKGEVVLFQAAQSNSPGTFCTVTDVTVTYNLFGQALQGVNILGVADQKGVTGVQVQGVHRILFRNNIFDDISGLSEWNKPSLTSAETNQSGAMLGVGNGAGPTNTIDTLTDVKFDHNTCMGTGLFLGCYNSPTGANPVLIRQAYTNNMVQLLRCDQAHPWGNVRFIVGGSSVKWDQVGLDAFFASDLFSRNVCFDPAGAPAEVQLYNPGQFIGDTAANVQFVNYNNGDGGNYELQATSPYKGAGTDGKDIGADAASVYSKTAGVVD